MHDQHTHDERYHHMRREALFFAHRQIEQRLIALNRARQRAERDGAPTDAIDAQIAALTDERQCRRAADASVLARIDGEG